MKKILLIAAALLLIGAGCPLSSSQPVPTPAPLPIPTPAPDPHGPAAHADLIVADSPQPNDTVASPLTVTGKARGSWYFEASFPVKLVDANGTVLASGPATAQGDWMTAEFVPFKITLSFPTPITATGTIELHKDNPSGLPEHEDQLNIPVVFKTADLTQLTACRATGCSSQLCAEEDMVTTCEYKDEYACYKSAKCERQKDGKCGWTSSVALTTCLKAPPKVNL